MSIKDDFLRSIRSPKAYRFFRDLEDNLLDGELFSYDDDATLTEKAAKNIGEMALAPLKTGKHIQRHSEDVLGGREYDFDSEQAFDIITSIPALKAMGPAAKAVVKNLNPGQLKKLAKDPKAALEYVTKKMDVGKATKGPLPKGTSPVDIDNPALKNTIKNLPDPNRTSLNQGRNILGIGKGQTLGQRGTRLGLAGLAIGEKANEIEANNSVDAPESSETDASDTSTVDLENPDNKMMSGDIEIKAKPAQPQYNPNKADASLDLARNIGNLRQTDKSPNTNLLRNVQRKALNESNQILKGQYDKAARARAAQAKFDEREENMRSKWNNSRTGKESGISWDQLDDETKQSMRKRANDFFRNQNQTQTMQEPAAQPVSQSTGSPMSTKYSPVFGEKGFTGYNDTTDGRFIPSAGVGQKDMLNSLVKQDSDDAVKRSMFQDNNPFGSEYRPLASKPIMTGPTPRTDSMMDTINAMPQNEQLDVINSFRRKRGEEDIYNPFA